MYGTCRKHYLHSKTIIYQSYYPKPTPSSTLTLVYNHPVGAPLSCCSTPPPPFEEHAPPRTSRTNSSSTTSSSASGRRRGASSAASVITTSSASSLALTPAALSSARSNDARFVLVVCVKHLLRQKI